MTPYFQSSACLNVNTISLSQATKLSRGLTGLSKQIGSLWISRRLAQTLPASVSHHPPPWVYALFGAMIGLFGMLLYDFYSQLFPRLSTSARLILSFCTLFAILML